MGTSLTGLKIKDSYSGLLKTSDNGALGASAKQITDGLGTGSPIYVSTSNVGIGVSPSAKFHTQVSSETTIAIFENTTGKSFNILTDINKVYLSEGTSSATNSFIINGTDSQLEFRTNGSEAMRIDSSGNVGINSQTNNTLLHLRGLTNQVGITLENPQARKYQLFSNGSTGGGGASAGSFAIYDATAASDVFLIDSSGNVLIGNNGLSVLSEKLNITGNGIAIEQTDGGVTTMLGAFGSSDVILGAYTSTNVQLRTGNTERMRITSDGILVKYGDSSSARIIPQTDGVGFIGEAAARWNTIYASTGTINTSDANEKQDILDLEQAELNVATAIKGLIKKFRFKDAVAEKGADARIHIGAIAQEVEAAFTSEGLDANKYGLFCSDTWWAVPATEVLDEEGNIVYETEQVLVSEAVEAVIEIVEHEAIAEELDADGNVIVEAQDAWNEEVIVTPAQEAVYETIVTDVPKMTEAYNSETEVANGVKKTRLGLRYEELLAFVISAL